MGSSAWDKNEQRLLEDGLRYYPHDQHSNMFIYIRIAAQLPKKTVRDVAHHLRHMQVSERARIAGPSRPCGVMRGRRVLAAAYHTYAAAAAAAVRTRRGGLQAAQTWP